MIGRVGRNRWAILNGSSFVPRPLIRRMCDEERGYLDGKGLISAPPRAKPRESDRACGHWPNREETQRAQRSLAPTADRAVRRAFQRKRRRQGNDL